MPTLTDVTLDPSGPESIDLHAYIRFTAIGHFDDSTSRNLTQSEVSFSSSDDTVATVANDTAHYGRAYSVGGGKVTITANATAGPTASADVTVVLTLTSVTLDPADPFTINTDSYVQLTALGNFDDGSSRILNAGEVTYDSSDDTIATATNGEIVFGRVHGITAGTVTIHCVADAGPTASAHVTVFAPLPLDPPEARFSLGLGAPTLAAYPTWTAIDAHPNLVTSYTIDRGRAYELDQTDAGRATVNILDPDGILDPTNPDSPYHGQLRPMLQAIICRHNPVTSEWQPRYRGYVEDFSYDLDPSQQYNRLTVSLVDLFDIVGTAEMHPGQYGSNIDGQIVYPHNQVPRDRITQILVDTGVPDRMSVVFRGNVLLQRSTYSAGDSALTAIQDAANGEFPAVANVYCDRQGRLCFHGRQARFNPAGIAGIEGEWDYRDWNAGDSAAVAASPTDTAQARALSVQYGTSKIINVAVATETGAPDSQLPGRRVTDSTSIHTYGIRSWSQANLLTGSGDIDATYPTNAATETKRFAQFYVSNYAQPHGRVSSLKFQSLHPDDPRAAANWDLLSNIDISDTINITVAAAGGGGFDAEPYFVEGIHETVNPLVPEYDDVTVTLDLSPRAYYTVDPWVPLVAPDSTPTSDPTKTKRSSSGRSGLSLPSPGYHAADHQFGGPDPFAMHYENVGTGAGGGTPLVYSISGTLAVQFGGLRYYALADGTVNEVFCSVGTAPAGSGVTVSLNCNGTGIGTTTIAAGANTGLIAPGFSYAAGDYFTVDIVAVGSSTPGSDLVVEVA